MQNRCAEVLEWIPFLPQKLKAVLKIFHSSKFCGRIVAQAIFTPEIQQNRHLTTLGSKLLDHGLFLVVFLFTKFESRSRYRPLQGQKKS